MSKSPNGYMLPVVGGVTLVLGALTFWMSSLYNEGRVRGLESRVEASEARAAAEVERATEASAIADAASMRAAALEEQVSSIKAQRVPGVQMASLTAPAPMKQGGYGLGRTAHSEEIAAWDVDILPDGRGLPPGRGNVIDGEEIFADACGACHGDFAEGVDNWPVLAGGFDTLGEEDPVKTVGSYWPYLSTVWDYVHRSMPFGAAQTLSDDEVYAITAYILYSNDLVDEDFELSHENFSEFNMYNEEGFVIDDRPEKEYAMWSGEPCMTNCKPAAKITRKATDINVTPIDGAGTQAIAARVAAASMASAFAAPSGHAQINPVQVAQATPAQDSVEAENSENEALVKAGEKVFKKCKACHQVGAGAKNRSGPHLNGIVGRSFGGVEGFKYSKVFKAAKEEGRAWDEASLMEFLAKPKSYLKGTKMSFAGIKKDDDLQAIVAYLKSFESE